MSKKLLILEIALLIAVISCMCFIRQYFKSFHMPDGLENNMGGYVHFSIDDSNSIFEDLTLNAGNYKSIFEQPKLNFIKSLHDQYGIVISFYVYYSWDVEDDSFSLADTTDQFKEEFAENADWLRFGFHAKDADAYETIAADEEIEYYNKTIGELIRITGTEKCIDNFVRLDRFQADTEMVDLLHSTDEGIVGLLAADGNGRQSYALSADEMKLMNLEDWFSDIYGVFYTPTDVRLENIESDEEFYHGLVEIASQERIIVFTHEWILDDKNVQKYMSWFAQYANQVGKSFGFPEDNTGQ